VWNARNMNTFNNRFVVGGKGNHKEEGGGGKEKKNASDRAMVGKGGHRLSGAQKKRGDPISATVKKKKVKVT